MKSVIAYFRLALYLQFFCNLSKLNNPSPLTPSLRRIASARRHARVHCVGVAPVPQREVPLPDPAPFPVRPAFRAQAAPQTPRPQEPARGRLPDPRHPAALARQRLRALGH